MDDCWDECGWEHTKYLPIDMKQTIKKTELAIVMTILQKTSARGDKMAVATHLRTYIVH